MYKPVYYFGNIFLYFRYGFIYRHPAILAHPTFGLFIAVIRYMPELTAAKRTPHRVRNRLVLAANGIFLSPVSFLLYTGRCTIQFGGYYLGILFVSAVPCVIYYSFNTAFIPIGFSGKIFRTLRFKRRGNIF